MAKSNTWIFAWMCKIMLSLMNTMLQKLLSQLTTTNLTGSDEIPVKSLKNRSTIVSTPLASMRKTSMIDDFPIIHFVPVYKKGDCNYEWNYHPSSGLPAVSKVLERVIHNQVYLY